MKKRKVCISLFSLLAIAFFVASCSQQMGSGFLRKEFLDYQNVAILPFEGDNTGEVARTFGWNFHKRFPQISILGGRQFLDNPKEEKINLDQLDNATRLKIGRRVGAQALITGSIYSPSISSWFLQVKIIDTETGEVMGRSTVEIDSIFSTDIENATRLAVDKLSLW
jgi:PBP1b-binding outer membrane lipoprotein LpoB